MLLLPCTVGYKAIRIGMCYVREMHGGVLCTAGCVGVVRARG